MSNQSRTAKSLKNSVVAMGFYLVTLLLQFFSRKIFLEYLGTEILGLNTTCTNLLQFLNLAELGIGAAVSFSLFKPMHDDDHDTINDIVSLQGHIYRRIAMIIIVGAVILMCFFPLIFKKANLPLWYAYASFSALLLSGLLTYFVNYKQVALSASQQDYKIAYSYKSIQLAKLLAQIMALSLFPHPYIWWLILEGVFAILASISLHRMTMRTFPFLDKSKHQFGELRKRYKEIETKVKQLIFHKLGTFALSQSSPLIIYAFASLSLVALYGNYMIAITGIQMLAASVFNSMGAGVGHLVAEGDQSRIRAVFKELFTLRFLLVATLCFSTFVVMTPLIQVWIGSEYLLPESSLLLMVAIMFISMSRLTVDAFVNAFGLFKDIWAPVAEACLNIGLSIILGSKFGLNGILCGVLISLICTMVLWKPYFLITNHMKGFMPHYLYMYGLHLGLALVAAYASIPILRSLPIDPSTGYVNLGIYGVLTAFIYGLILFAALWILYPGMRKVVKRICGMLSQRLK